MEDYKVGETYLIEEVRNFAEEHESFFADLGRPNQASIRNRHAEDDVQAEFYLEGDKATCIFNIYDQSSYGVGIKTGLDN